MYAAIDFETTGVEPGYHEICQVAVVTDAASFVSYVRPEHPQRANPDAMEVHGITWEHLRNAPTSADVGDQIYEWLQQFGCRPIPLAHNWAFEWGHAATTWGPDWLSACFSHKARCTLQMARQLGLKHCRLGELCNHFGIPLTGAHDAYHDCVAEIALFGELNRPS